MENLVIVRGGGDIATGTIYKLHKCGFKVLVLEIVNPSAIRRNVSFCEAVYNGSQQVEDLTCTLAKNMQEAENLLNTQGIALMVDPDCKAVEYFKPFAVVDAIIAKKKLGMTMNMAPVTVALGPGFEAGKDVHAVVETMRGHNLGKVLYSGCAAQNTGVPGIIKGYGKERVIHSPAQGVLYNVKHITDTVKKGDVIALIKNVEETTEVTATLDGILRGLIRDGYPVTKGFKIADIDPRSEEYDNCFTISDKARCIAGGVVEAVMHLKGNYK
jgi:xanthine dehydrogenase accessory factor